MAHTIRRRKTALALTDNNAEFVQELSPGAGPVCRILKDIPQGRLGMLAIQLNTVSLSHSVSLIPVQISLTAKAQCDAAMAYIIKHASAIRILETSLDPLRLCADW